MSQITAAKKVERVIEVVLESGSDTLTVQEDAYNHGRYRITAKTENVLAVMLDDLLRFAQPQENECPPREITLQSVIDEMQRRRDQINESWGKNKGNPAPLSVEFWLDTDEVKAVMAVLKGGDLDYDVTSTLRKALTASSDW